jgi:hypothetical protein
LEKDLLFFKPDTPTYVPYFWGAADSEIYSNAPLLVYEILHGGYIYLSQMPSLDDLEAAVFSDPEVINVLKGNRL